MRIAVYVALVALAAIAVASGSWTLALVIGATKALLVAAEYMELRLAHRAHGVAFGLCVGALTAVLALVAAPR